MARPATPQPAQPGQVPQQYCVEPGKDGSTITPICPVGFVKENGHCVPKTVDPVKKKEKEAHPFMWPFIGVLAAAAVVAIVVYVKSRKKKTA